MALTIPCGTNETISIDEYLDHIHSNVDLRSLESIAASAPALRALANDRSLVVKELNEHIERGFAGAAFSSAASLMLGRGEHFNVRANIWPANADMANSRAYQDQFAYNIAHDHNFSFLTVNYLGPGYETEIYEYDYEKVNGSIGEPVDLQFLEKKKFGPGSVMLYRAGRDVHVQFAPEELTVTLNLMVALPEVWDRDQYYFDLGKRVIASYPNELQASGRVSLVTLAGHVGNSDTVQILSDLAESHPCRRTRLTAFEALCRQQPEQSQRIWEKACRDSAPLVANAALNRLKILGAR